MVFSTHCFDICQSQHRLARFSNGDTKKFYAIELLQFFVLKTQEHYILQVELNISKKELSLLIGNLPDSLKI